MKTFKIIDAYGKSHGYIEADNERQALCKYLMEHEELDDMMLYWSTFWNLWKLAEHDNEEECFVAREARKM